MATDDLAQTIRTILVPYVGRAIADTCVRATALTLGKTSDQLEREDLPRLEENIRRQLSPVAPMVTIDNIIRQIELEAA